MITNLNNMNFDLKGSGIGCRRLARRAGAAFLSMVLTVSLCLPAFASDTADSGQSNGDYSQEQTVDETLPGGEERSEAEEQEDTAALEESEEQISAEEASEEPAEAESDDNNLENEDASSDKGIGSEETSDDYLEIVQDEADSAEKADPAEPVDAAEAMPIEGTAAVTTGVEPSMDVVNGYSDWLSDYDYSVDDTNGFVDLNQYHGTETSITVPASAVVDNVVYPTRVSSCQSWNSNIENITFEQGVKIGETGKIGESGGYMFYGLSNLISVDISQADTSYVTNMSYMFAHCYSLQTVDMAGINTSSVRNMSYMFYNCNSLSSLDITGFDTSSVESADSMFEGCSSLTSLDLSGFEFSNSTSAYRMLDGCASLQEIWTPRNLTMVYGGEVQLPNSFMDDDGNRWNWLPIDVDTSIHLHVPQISEWLKDYEYSTEGDRIILNYCYLKGTSDIVVPGMAEFDGTEYTRIVLSPGVFGNTGVQHLSFEHGVELPEDCDSMFSGMKELQTVDFTNVDSSLVQGMNGMFRSCENLTDPGLQGLDFSSVTDVACMFDGCRSLTDLDLSFLDFHNVYSLYWMLNGCSGLQTLRTPANVHDDIDLPIPMMDENGKLWSTLPRDLGTSILLTRALVSEWLEDYSFEIITDDESGEDMIFLNKYSGDETEITVPGSAIVGDRQYNVVEITSGIWGRDITSLTFEAGVRFPYYSAELFAYMDSLETLDLSAADTSKVKTMERMFYWCRSLRSLDLSGMDTSQVVNMGDMFNGCTSLESVDLSSFDFSSVYYDDFEMFSECTSLTSIIAPAGARPFISLPVPFEDDNGEIYASLPVGSAEPVTLTRASCSEWLNDYRFNVDGDILVLNKYTGGDYSGNSSVHVHGAAQVGNKSFDRIQIGKYVFSGCSSVESITFDQGVFFRGDYSDFFSGMTSLASVDFSNVDMSQVENAVTMFSGCGNLQTIVTPVGLTVQADLPAAFVDEDGNIYGQLPMNQSEAMTLTRAEASEWLKDYTYTVSGDTIVLTGYTGWGGSVTVPANAVINNTEFSRIQVKRGVWNKAYSLNLSFEEGVLFPEDSSRLFADANAKSIDLRGVDTSNVTNMSGMFDECNDLNSLNLTGIDTSRVTDMSEMFSGCGGWSGDLVIDGLEGLDTSNVTNMHHMFTESRLNNLNLSGFNTSKVTDMSGMFSWGTFENLDLSSFDTTSVTDMSSMFSLCRGVARLDLSSFNTSNVTNMSAMFLYSGIQEIDFTGWDTSKVTDMSNMFTECRNLQSLELGSFNTSNVTDFHGMFTSCTGLQSLDLSSFNTSSVTDMAEMFEWCESLQSLDLSGFNTSNVTDMQSMFDGCEALTSLDLSSFDMSSAEYISSMFEDCTSLMDLDISFAGMPSLKKARRVFDGCKNLLVIKAPRGLTESIDLPGMYTGTEDGVLYTALPQEQADSITLTFVSESGDAAGSPDQTVIQVTSQPESIEVRTGDTATFHVGAEGEGLTYQWYTSADKRTWSPVSGPAYSGADTDTLTFTMGAGYAGNYYNCRLTGGPADSRTTLFTKSARAYLDSAFTITADPEDTEARAGEAVTLHVGVDAPEAVTYQWQWSADGETWKNCTSGGYNTDTFSFRMSAVLDGRRYRCVVSDGTDTLESGAAMISLIRVLAITEQPADATAEAGEQVTLHIGTDGDNVTYQWQWSADGSTWKNCTSVGCNTDTFGFRMSAVLDGRRYRCVVSDGKDTLESGPALISLAAGLEITEQPADTSAEAGEQVTLHIGTDGDNVTYQWQWSSNGTTWKNCTSAGSKTDTFGFRMSEVLDGRRYRCVVSDGKETLESGPALISLAAGFEITEQPADTTAEAGEQVTLHVGARGKDLSYQWQWSSNGTTWKNCTSAGSKTDTFGFRMSEVLDGRQYRCVVSDGKETLESGPALISLAAGFEITEQPADTTAEAGEQVTLHVGARGKDLSYQWQWSSNGTTWKNCTSAGSKTDTFGFRMSEVLDGRQYRCVVTDGEETLNSEPANIMLKKSGGITEQPEDVLAAAGEQVTLHVAAEGSSISYQWQWSSNGTTWKNCTSAGSTTDTFGFKMSAQLDGRQYRCVLTVDGETVISDAAIIKLK